MSAREAEISMKINILALGLLSLAFSACSAGRGGQNQINDSWAGMPFDDFVLRYGSPQSKYALSNGDVAYLWDSGASSIGMPSHANTQNSGDHALPQYSGSGNVDVFCEVQIITGKEGIIKQINIMRDTMGTRTTSRCREVIKKH